MGARFLPRWKCVPDKYTSSGASRDFSQPKKRALLTPSQPSAGGRSIFRIHLAKALVQLFEHMKVFMAM